MFFCEMSPPRQRMRRMDSPKIHYLLADNNLLATDDVEARLQVRCVVGVANLGTVDGVNAFRSNHVGLFVSYDAIDSVNVACASDYNISEFAFILL